MATRPRACDKPLVIQGLILYLTKWNDWRHLITVYQSVQRVLNGDVCGISSHNNLYGLPNIYRIIYNKRWGASSQFNHPGPKSWIQPSLTNQPPARVWAILSPLRISVQTPAVSLCAVGERRGNDQAHGEWYGSQDWARGVISPSPGQIVDRWPTVIYTSVHVQYISRSLRNTILTKSLRPKCDQHENS